ncbi:MAG: hypothetical protein AB1938_16915 [Myxococcota bacterium]
MKRLIVSAVFFLSVSVLAQDRNAAKAAAASRAQPMPIAAGGSFFGKTPKLRSWVLGWALTGSKPDAYEIRCDDVFTDCAIPILRTRALASEPYGMGSLTHSEGAQPWRGARVELKAELRTGRVDGWAGLWMRIDGPDGKVLAFDNMQNRPLRGTTSFQWYSVVLDVPADAERISFGVMLHGPGAVFIRELHFDAADTEVTSTDLVGPLRAQTP